MKDALMNAGNWLAANWVPVALIVSEIAALLPTKANGIIQGVLKVLAETFKKKKK
jgi:hypothetical protein